MSRGLSKEGCVSAEGEFGRGETERERGDGKETGEEGGREVEEENSPLADYVPSPPRSFTPAMFFLHLPLSSTTADDLAGYTSTPRLPSRPHPFVLAFLDALIHAASAMNVTGVRTRRCDTLDFV